MSFSREQFLESGAIMSVSHEKLLLGWGKAFQTAEHAGTDPSFYFTDFFLTSSKPWKHYRHWLELTIHELRDALGVGNADSHPRWIYQQPGCFKQAFQELSKELHSSRLKKAVLYLFATSHDVMTKERLCRALCRSLVFLEKRAGHLYGQWNQQEGILGLTPESLFSHSEEHPQMINTMAVAGTCHPSQDVEAFFHDEKERHEHQLVVQGICHSLKELGSINVGDVQLLRLPKLVHLMTPIELTLTHQFNFEALVQRMHPTPALGAFPLAEGKRWLHAWDKHTPRHFYGAPVGFHYPQKGLSKCFVAIRNVQWSPSGMKLGAGCGVVKQSTFEGEWREIQFKIRAIRDQLHL